MTIKDLSQLYYLKREIAYLQKRLSELEESADCFRAHDYVKGSSTAFPFTLRDIKVEGIIRGGSAKLNDIHAEIQYIKGIINLNLDKSMTEYSKLCDYIAGIDDCLIRQIISLRFLEGLKWRDVAQRIGGGNSDKSLQMLLKRFLADN